MSTNTAAKVKFFFMSDIVTPLKVHIEGLEGVIPVDRVMELAARIRAGPTSLLSGGTPELLIECQLLIDGKLHSMPVYTKYRTFRPTQTGKFTWRETLTFPVRYEDLSAINWQSCALHFRLWDLSPSNMAGGMRKRQSEHPLEETIAPSFGSGRIIGEGKVSLISPQRVLETGQRQLLLLPPGEKVKPGIQTVIKVGSKGQKLHGVYVSREGNINHMRWLSKLESYRLQSIRLHKPSFHSPNKLVELSKNLRAGIGTDTYPILQITLPEFKYPVVAMHAVKDSKSPILPKILPMGHPERLFVLHDPGMDKPNPVEIKFQKLAKKLGQASLIQIKPNVRERQALRRIIEEPYHLREVKSHDKELLWKFRYRLTTMKNTITRFLRCVDFSDADEKEEALKMMKIWEKEKTVSTEDALELLSEDFKNEDVRKFAVKQLDKENNTEIEKYLMLLVQALQYEHGYPSPLSEFICKRSAQKLTMATAVNWYLTVEAAEAPKMYSAVLREFRNTHLTATEEGKKWKKDIENQMQMVDDIRSLCRMVTTKGGKQSRRVENLRAALQEDGKFAELTKFKSPVRFPLDPSVLLSGIVPEKSTVFASNAFPVLLAFQRHNSEEIVRVIYKDGDDLRQDQLIMQLVKLMDSRLKKQGLDLQLISFQVQGWSAKDGVVEFVPGCNTVASVIDESKEIGKFLQEHNHKPKLMENALNNWVKSSAGYSVLTYILAIGDRHLDNILLTKDGHMLHIDFGYIFGRDPKPFPPKVKFTKDMMDAMGGPEFEEQFYEKSCISYNLLRRDACLILNLIALTGDWAGNKKDNLAVVGSRLALERNDDDAAKDYKLLIYKVMHSNFEALKDGIHTIATNLKK
ncbi:hypothetical protein AAMO2058_000468200 [Amorphochlora amoebiformis]